MTDQPLDLAPIQAREQAASKGPWFQHPDWTGRVFSDEPFNVHIARFTSTAADANAAFVAGARQDVPALIAEVARLREENARLTTELTVEYNPAAAPKTIIQLAQHVEPESRQFYEDETGGTVRIFTSYRACRVPLGVVEAVVAALREAAHRTTPAVPATEG